MTAKPERASRFPEDAKRQTSGPFVTTDHDYPDAKIYVVKKGEGVTVRLVPMRPPIGFLHGRD